MSFGSFIDVSNDPLLALMAAFKADTRTRKIDLGVGVYRDCQGNTPVFAAVKAAEHRLAQEQVTKSYLGSEGDVEFVRLLGRAVFGGRSLPGLQTVGGTGALRLAADFLRRSGPQRRVWLGVPTWPNHVPIFTAAGLRTKTVDTWDERSARNRPELLLEQLQHAEPGDVVLLHGCCHNPTGIDPAPDFWRRAADRVRARGLVALIDCAYQGLGLGWDEDAAGFNEFIARVPSVLIAYSCDKNVGLYRERVGALFVGGTGDGGTGTDEAAWICGHLSALARTQYSMPPDHGAAVVRLILQDHELTRLWRSELETMRTRIQQLRTRLAAYGCVGNVDLSALGAGNGLFALLPLSGANIEHLRREFAVYLAPNGRMNIAGLAERDVPRFVDALSAIQRRSAA